MAMTIEERITHWVNYRIRDKAGDFYRQGIEDLLTPPSPRPKSRRRVIVKAKGKSPHNTREAGRY
ncbi:hypothetical protein FACS1894130_05320 [Spirochaetia bacterium]|nr:hypothetical protein FACS1894130_05320 [Spirochaetia bacterium]